MPGEPDIKFPPLPHDNFEEFRTMVQKRFEYCRHIAKTTNVPSHDSRATLVNAVETLEQDLGKCLDKLEKDIEDLETKISDFEDGNSDVRDKKIWQKQLDNKNLYKNIVVKERDNIPLEKFNLMEIVQKAHVKIKQSGN